MKLLTQIQNSAQITALNYGPDLDIAYENQFAKTTNCLHLKLLACEHTVLPHIFLVHIDYDSFFLLKLFMNSIRPLESRY